MPIAKVQLQDGRIAKFEVPAGTSPDQVVQFASQQFGGSQPTSPPDASPPSEIGGFDVSAGIPKPFSEEKQTGIIPRIREAITGKERQTEETRTLPRMVDIPYIEDRREHNKMLHEVVKSQIVSKDAAEFAADMMDKYPGSSLREDDKGNVILKDKEGREQLINPPGLDATDIMTAVGKMAYYGASLAGGGVGKIATPLTAAMTYGQAHLAEKASKEYDAMQPLTETAMVVLPDVLRAVSPTTWRGTNNLWGVSMGNLEKTDKNLAKSVYELVESVPAAIRKATPTKAREQLGSAFKAEAKALKKNAFELLGNAKKANPEVDLSGVYNQIDDAMKVYAPDSAEVKMLQGWKDRISKSETFEQLHTTRKAIDKSIKPPIGSVDATTAANLGDVDKGIREALSDAMKGASPDYAKSMSIQSKAIPQIESISKDIMGKIAKAKGSGYDKAAQKLFSSSEGAFKRARAILDKHDPDLVKGLAQNEMRRRFRKIYTTDTAKMASENPAKMISEIKKAIFPKGPASRNMQAAYSPMEKRMLSQLETMLDTASKSRKGADREMLTSMGNFLNAGFTVGNKASALGAERKAISIVEALTNPNLISTKEMQQFMKIKMRSPAGVREGIRLLSMMTDELTEAIPEEVLVQPEEEQQPQLPPYIPARKQMI